MFTGSIVALVTPFHPDRSLDEETLRQLVDWHIESGTNGIVPCGTTGESATLSHEEHRQVVKIVVEQANGRIPVIAGAGSNCTREAVELTEFAKEVGADAVLSISPYYNKPMPEGMFQHFKAVDAVGIPIVAYNVPSRTGKNMPAATTLRLARELNNVVAVKEASGDIAQAMKIVQHAPDGFHVLSGEDALTFPMMSIGVKGCISVVANEIPAEFSRMINSALEGDWETARKIHYKHLDLMDYNFVETNPIPVKTALGLMKKINPTMRLPLTPMDHDNLELIRSEIQDLGLM
jgi:4-hydroxy-tetrahydrodipicolinate synthase